MLKSLCRYFTSELATIQAHSVVLEGNYPALTRNFPVYAPNMCYSSYWRLLELKPSRSLQSWRRPLLGQVWIHGKQTWNWVSKVSNAKVIRDLGSQPGGGGGRGLFCDCESSIFVSSSNNFPHCQLLSAPPRISMNTNTESIETSASKRSIRRFVITEKAPAIIRDWRFG